MKIEELPFVSDADLWAVTESGDWATDNALGREYAAACITYMHRADNAPFLARLMPHVVAKGRVGPIEIGFFTYLAMAASNSG